jgi:mannitol 2-dehydrogenase
LDRTALIVAAWVHYLNGVDEKGNHYPILDPQLAILKLAVANKSALVENILALEDVFGSDIPKSTAFVEAFTRQLERLQSQGVHATLKQVLNL